VKCLKALYNVANTDCAFSCDSDFRNENQKFPGVPYWTSIIVLFLRSTRHSLVQKPSLWSSWISVRWSFRHLNMKILRTNLGSCKTSMIPQQVGTQRKSVLVWFILSAKTNGVLMNPTVGTLSCGASKNKMVGLLGRGQWCLGTLPPWSLSTVQILPLPPTSFVPLGSVLTSQSFDLTWKTGIKNRDHNTFLESKVGVWDSKCERALSTVSVL
jgi:hypothetical protein